MRIANTIDGYSVESVQLHSIIKKLFEINDGSDVKI